MKSVENTALTQWKFSVMFVLKSVNSLLTHSWIEIASGLRSQKVSTKKPRTIAAPGF